MTSWPHFSAECRADVDRILRSGKLTAYRANPKVGVGPTEESEAWRLEREIEKKFRVRHAVAVSSGTAALHAALTGLGVAGKDVVTSPFTFSATASAILLSGATPIFADVDPDTFCITKESVKRVITKKTAAILPVNLFGFAPDLSPLLSIGLPVVEDACQSVGAERDGKRSGTHGIAGAFSFNGSKNLPSGEGGALVTNDERIAERARRFVNHSENFGTQEVGVNYRMHEIVACLARHGLKELDERNDKRRALARAFYADCPFPTATSDHHVYYCTPFKVDGWRRDVLAKRSAKRGVTVGQGYISPILSRYKAFRKYVTRPLPVATELSERSLALLYCLTPEKKIEYARKVARIIREAMDA